MNFLLTRLSFRVLKRIFCVCLCVLIILSLPNTSEFFVESNFTNLIMNLFCCLKTPMITLLQNECLSYNQLPLPIYFFIEKLIVMNQIQPNMDTKVTQVAFGLRTSNRVGLIWDPDWAVKRSSGYVIQEVMHVILYLGKVYASHLQFFSGFSSPFYLRTFSCHLFVDSISGVLRIIYDYNTSCPCIDYFCHYNHSIINMWAKKPLR